MHRCHRRTQSVRINSSFRSPPLFAGLRFRNPILDSLNAVAARECAPRSYAVRLQDDVRVNEHGAMMSSHRTSHINWMRDSVCREQIRHVFNGETENVG